MLHAHGWLNLELDQRHGKLLAGGHSVVERHEESGQERLCSLHAERVKPCCFATDE
jgi:hypothetical protein